MTPLTDWLQAVGSLATACALGVGYRQVRLLGKQIADERERFSLAQQAAIEERQAQAARFSDEQGRLDARLSQQLRDETRRTQQQNAFALIQYLEQPRNLRIRRKVRDLEAKPFEAWDEHDLRAADDAQRLWTVVAFYQRQDQVLPEHFVHRYWGNTVREHWEILRPYVEALRRRRGEYMAADFEDVARETDRLGWFVDGKDQRPPLT